MIEKEKPVRGCLYVITCFIRLFEYLLNILGGALKKYGYAFMIRIENIRFVSNDTKQDWQLAQDASQA